MRTRSILYRFPCGSLTTMYGLVVCPTALDHPNVVVPSIRLAAVQAPPYWDENAAMLPPLAARARFVVQEGVWVGWVPVTVGVRVRVLVGVRVEVRVRVAVRVGVTV